MFIILLSYKVENSIVDKYLDEHIEFLKFQYEKGYMITSGRKVPRTGGVILSIVESKEKLMKILDQDPFKKNDVATYEIVEFIPSMFGSGYENLK